MTHWEIPNYLWDGEYLDLLGKSAQAGYAPAMAKLGEYAMRRMAWVEAYYWMKLAQRNGMHGISPTLRTIRGEWARSGFHGNSTKINDFFTNESASIGRALINLDSRRDAASAREYLKAHHPEFL